MIDFLQDWCANRGNAKGRLVLFAFRIANAISRIKSPWRLLFLPYIVLYRVTVEWILGVELPWKLSVGKGLRLYHGQALVINDKARIGEGCILRHSTTIGVSVTSTDYSGAAPIIGNYVDIGSNVVIIGEINIGDHALIGAGSVVLSDVPPYGVAVGNPAKVVRVRNERPEVACK